jgi:hypothetical protein
VSGVTLERLPLRRGWWRVGPTSADIRECDPPEACTGGTPSPATSTSIWAEYLCADGHAGPKCETCAIGHRETGSGQCEPCSGNQAVAWVVVAIVVVIVAACLVALLWRRKGDDDGGSITKLARARGPRAVNKAMPMWRKLATFFILPLAVLNPAWVHAQKGVKKHKAKIRILVTMWQNLTQLQLVYVPPERDSNSHAARDQEIDTFHLAAGDLLPVGLPTVHALA